MNKQKGVFTIVVALSIILIMSFALVLSDYARIYSAKSKADIISDNSVDTVLVEYDKKLNEDYRLFAIKNDSKYRESVKNFITLSTKQMGSKIGVSNLSLESVDVNLSKNLCDTEVLKAAILKANEQEFVVMGLSKFIDKMNLLKDVSKYTDMVSKYTQVLESLAKAKSDYDKLKKVKNDLKKLYAKVKSKNLNKIVAEIYSDKKFINNADKDTISVRTKKISISKNTKLLLENIKLVRTYAAKLKEYSSALGSFSKSVSNTINLAKKNISAIKSIKVNRKEEAEKILNLILGIVDKLTDVSDYSLEQIDKIDVALKKTQDKLKIVDKILKEGKNLKNFNLDFRSNLDFNPNSNATFLFDSGKTEASVSIIKMLKLFYRIVMGKFFDKRIERADIPSSELIKLKGLSSKRLKFYNDANVGVGKSVGNIMKTLSNSSKSQNFNISVGKKIYNKYIVSDYVVNMFTYDDTKKFSLKKSPKTPIYGAEVEYILSGNKSSDVNIFNTDMKIFSIRFVLNLVAISVNKNEELNAIATTMSSWTGFIGYPLAYGFSLTAWAAIESYIDIQILHNSGAIAIYKQADDINFSLNIKSLKKLLDVNKLDNYKNNSKLSDIKTLNYKEFLMIFLMIESEKETLVRIGDLYKLRSNLDLADYSSVVNVKFRYKLNRLLPLSANGISFSKRSPKFYNYDVEITRGY